MSIFKKLSLFTAASQGFLGVRAVQITNTGEEWEDLESHDCVELTLGSKKDGGVSENAEGGKLIFNDEGKFVAYIDPAEKCHLYQDLIAEEDTLKKLNGDKKRYTLKESCNGHLQAYWYDDMLHIYPPAGHGSHGPNEHDKITVKINSVNDTREKLDYNSSVVLTTPQNVDEDGTTLISFFGEEWAEELRQGLPWLSSTETNGGHENEYGSEADGGGNTCPSDWKVMCLYIVVIFVLLCLVGHLLCKND